MVLCAQGLPKVEFISRADGSSPLSDQAIASGLAAAANHGARTCSGSIVRSFVSI